MEAVTPLICSHISKYFFIQLIIIKQPLDDKIWGISVGIRDIGINYMVCSVWSSQSDGGDMQMNYENAVRYVLRNSQIYIVLDFAEK